MIVYCCTDLIFSTRIRSTAEALGVGSRPARDVEMLSKRLEQVEDGKLNEPVKVVLVDLDLGETALELIERCKAHASAPQVVAFGSHVAKALLSAAEARGADLVLPRSQFTAMLPDLLRQAGGGDKTGTDSNSVQ